MTKKKKIRPMYSLQKKEVMKKEDPETKELKMRTEAEISAEYQLICADLGDKLLHFETSKSKALATCAELIQELKTIKALATVDQTDLPTPAETEESK